MWKERIVKTLSSLLLSSHIPRCCAASSSPRLKAKPCLHLIPSHCLPFLVSSSLSTYSVSFISLVKTHICLPPWFSHKHNPWPCPNFKLGHCTSHPVWLLTKLPVSVIRMQTCDPCSSLRKKPPSHHCPILLFPIVLLPSTNSVLFYFLRIPCIYLPFRLQLHDLCSPWTNCSLLPALQLHDLHSSQQTIPSSFIFSCNLPVGFPSFSSCPPPSAYNYQVELYRMQCLIIPHENTMPRWLHTALEIKTNDVFNTHSTSLASTFSLLSSPTPDGHRAVFWFF